MRRTIRTALGGLLAPCLVVAANADAGGGLPDSTEEREPRWELPSVRVTASPLPDPLGPFPLATTRLDRRAIASLPISTGLRFCVARSTSRTSC